MEEKAINFRSWVWFSPPRPPRVMERIAVISRMVWLTLFDIASRSDMGASFCHVRIIRPVSIVVPWVTSGSQKWNGAAAIFIIKDKVMMVIEVWSDISVISQWDVFRAFIVAANNMVMEARVWVRKYFVAASVARGWCGLEIIGVIESVLISRQAQAMSQCVDAATRVVLRVMVVGIINQVMRLIGKGLVGIFGVWAQ